MASGQVVTALECEGHGNFDFNAWVARNRLNQMQEHELTTTRTISTQSQEFRNVICDPVVLSTSGHVLPQYA